MPHIAFTWMYVASTLDIIESTMALYLIEVNIHIHIYIRLFFLS